MDSPSEVEDFPVDNLIQELNSFVESCSKNEEIIKDTSEHSCKERNACSSYIKQTMQDESNVNSLHNMKNKRKSGIPIKNLKPKNALGLNNERSSFGIEKARKKSKIRRSESDFEEEFPLIIDENRKKRRRSSMIQTGDIPEEILNVMVKSGIDDQLENVAMKEKLTDTIVKNIIKQVVTNKSVQAMIKKDIYGMDTDDPDLETFEPKLTRAKTKELIEKQIINPEEVNHSCGESPKSKSVRPETCALVTTEFPEDEDDEEYRPELDDT
ncbi:GON-4-like protein, partial [Armadillidium nasatum]